MSDTPNLDQLKYYVDRLKHLLDDPQPGLFTWNMFVAETIGEIAKFGGYAK